MAGDFLEFFGAITRTFTTEKTCVFILPEELKPSAAIEAQLLVDVDANTAEGILFIGTDGRGEILSLTRPSPFDPAPETEVFMLNALTVKLK